MQRIAFLLLLAVAAWPRASTAAASVGDDVLMAQAGQVTDPDTSTRGSTEEGASWRPRGFNDDSPTGCGTFSAA